MKFLHKILTRIIHFVDRFIHQLSPEERKQLIEEIKHSASPGFDFFLLVILSCSIATLGLITNSPAVIIGAMLLAPIMSPIIGLGLASIIGDDRIIKASTSALFKGAFLAILLSFLMTLLNRVLPFVSLQELPTEILARIRPTPIDLLIALVGGTAAAYAMTRPNLSATLPGVAIATALMPPLCTIGIGLAMNRWEVASGATLLFLTNTITIAFASAFVFFIRGFSVEAKRTSKKLPRSLILSAILVLILLVPLSYYSFIFFRDASENRLINAVVSQEVAKMHNSQLIDIETVQRDEIIEMRITLRTNSSLRYQEVVTLQEAIVDALQKPVSLKINQVIAEQLDPLIPPTPTNTPTATYTPTLGPSPTLTPLPTSTSTPTPKPTSTPSSAYIQVTGLPILQLYQSPGGPVIGKLKTGQSITILYGRQVKAGIIWLEVQDTEGRLGWLPEIYVQHITTSPTP